MRSEADAILSLQRFVAAFLPEPWDVRLTVEAGTEPQRPYALIEQAGSAASSGPPVTQDITAAYTVNLYLPAPASGSREEADAAALALRELVWRAFKWGPDARRPTTDRVPLYAYEPRNAVHRVSVRGATAGTWRLRQPAGTWTAPIPFDAMSGAVAVALSAILPAGVRVTARGRQVFDIEYAGGLAGVDVALLELDAGALTVPARYRMPVAGMNGPPAIRVILHGAPAPWRGPADYMRVVSFAQTTIRDPDEPALAQVAVDVRCTFARGLPVPLDQMLLQRVSATSGIGR